MIGIITHVQINLPLLCIQPHFSRISTLYLSDFCILLLAPNDQEANVSIAPLRPYIIEYANTLMSMFPIPTPARRAALFKWPIQYVFTNQTNCQKIMPTIGLNASLVTIHNLWPNVVGSGGARGSSSTYSESLLIAPIGNTMSLVYF